MDLALNNLERLICHKTQPINNKKLENFLFIADFSPHLGSSSFLFWGVLCFFFDYVSVKFHVCPSGNLPRPRIGMLSLVTVSPVITGDTVTSCCLSDHVFDQVNLWPAWVGFETAIFRQYSTPLSATPRAPKGDQGWIFWSYKPLSGLPESGRYRIFCTCL